MIETELQELFHQYAQIKADIDHLSNQNYIRLKKDFFEKFHMFVYETARKKFYLDEDMASDFYMYFTEKSGKLMDKFDPSRGVDFFSYLSIYMRKEMNGFYAKQNKIYQEYTVDMDWENTIAQPDPEENMSGHPAAMRVIQKTLNLIDPEKGISTKLFYGFPLKLGQMRLLLKKHRNLSFFTMFRDYLQNEKKFQKNMTSRKKKYYSKLENLERQLMETTDTEERKKIREKIQKVASGWLKGFSVTTYSTVARLMRRGLKATMTAIRNGTRMLEKIISRRGKVLLWNR